ncbi:hypothetical protein [Salirhabdus salicampi]|uniref:hypothetical protein n=1 Tax=Salirhabdus salicampi TaxID=476102 RepID=UPI0020C22E04|nr:hypothetical protein [Salirhabdus salicampi]MCP8615816.1 hypothetical protein [Salirhabdus salicampi]
MRNGFLKLFIGFLFLFLEFRIGPIDVLADPAGIGFIYVGLDQLSKVVEVNATLRQLTALLIVLALPSMFYPKFDIHDEWSWWGIYNNGVGFMYIILTYHLFQYMLKVASHFNHHSLFQQTSRLFPLYIIVVLITEMYLPFTMNFHNSLLNGLILILILVVFLLYIMFLLLLLKYRRVEKVE